MPIQFNAGDRITQLNTSRIEKLMTAETKEAALYMGPWDKFKDLFKTGDNKKAAQIEKIYDSITKAPTNDQAPLGMAVRFKNLRDLATDEAKEKFDMAGYALDGTNGEWEYVLLIDDQKIYESPVLQDTPESSFQNFSDYEMFFNGKGVEIHKPAEVNNIETAIQDVLYTLTADHSDSEIPPEVNLIKNYKSIFELMGFPKDPEDGDGDCVRLDPSQKDEYKNALLDKVTKHLNELSPPQLLQLHSSMRSNNLHGCIRYVAANIYGNNKDINLDDEKEVRSDFLAEIDILSEVIFAVVENKLTHETFANLAPVLWNTDPDIDAKFSIKIPEIYKTLCHNVIEESMSFDTALGKAEIEAILTRGDCTISLPEPDEFGTFENALLKTLHELSKDKVDDLALIETLADIDDEINPNSDLIDTEDQGLELRNKTPFNDEDIREVMSDPVALQFALSRKKNTTEITQASISKTLDVLFEDLSLGQLLKVHKNLTDKPYLAMTYPQLFMDILDQQQDELGDTPGATLQVRAGYYAQVSGNITHILNSIENHLAKNYGDELPVDSWKKPDEYFQVPIPDVEGGNINDAVSGGGLLRHHADGVMKKGMTFNDALIETRKFEKETRL